MGQLKYGPIRYKEIFKLKILAYLLLRYHRKLLKDAKDIVYFKMVFARFLELFTLVVSFFIFQFI